MPRTGSSLIRFRSKRWSVTTTNHREYGWVLVTLMTAGLVVLIWAVAGPALSDLFEQAIQRVSGIQ